jgi:phosphoesterase RecJ-like protein
MNNNKDIYSNIIDYINRASNILITAHEEPDGDSIGSQLALAGYIRCVGKNVTIINRGLIPAKYRFIPESGSIIDSSQYAGNNHYDLAIILDCPRIGRIGNVADIIGNDIPIINIDHHADNTSYGIINMLDPAISSVGEMLYEFFRNSQIAIDVNMAISLYVAIITDTGRFRFRSTTRRTMEIAGHLIDLGADPRDICDKIYYSILPETLKMTGQVLSGIEFYEAGKICLLQMSRQTLIENKLDIGETDGLTDYSMFGEGVVVGVMLKEIDATRTKVSLRSRDGIDVSLLAQKYGGGGHRNAAGYTLELSMRNTAEKVLIDVRRLINA